MKFLFTVTIATAVFCLPIAASADQFETTELFEKGAWAVEIAHDTSDGELWCSAGTASQSAQNLAILGYDFGEIALLVLDGSWDIPERPVRFIVDTTTVGGRWMVLAGTFPFL